MSVFSRDTIVYCIKYNKCKTTQDPYYRDYNEKQSHIDKWKETRIKIQKILQSVVVHQRCVADGDARRLGQLERLISAGFSNS